MLAHQPGIAFNEGWAEFWAGEVGGPPACSGIPADDWSVEGNVAAALGELTRVCLGVGRRQLVEVLAAHRGQIHSYPEFRARLHCAARATPVPPPPARPPEVAPRASEDALVAEYRRQLRDLTGQARQLQRSIGPALRAARRAAARPRLADLAARIRPEVLRVQLRVARMTADSYRLLTTRTGLRRYGALDPAAAFRRIERESARYARAVAREEARMIRRVLRASRSALRRQRPAFRWRFQSTLRRALAKMAALPAGLVATVPGDRVTRTPVRTFAPPPETTPEPEPEPEPTPPPTPEPAESTLTVTCPERPAPVGEPLEVAGAIDPPHDGAVVTVTYERKSAVEAEHHSRTGADGRYTDRFPPPSPAPTRSAPDGPGTETTGPTTRLRAPSRWIDGGRRHPRGRRREPSGPFLGPGAGHDGAQPPGWELHQGDVHRTVTLRSVLTLAVSRRHAGGRPARPLAVIKQVTS